MTFNYYETVKLGMFNFRIYQPTIIDLDRMNFEFNTIEQSIEVLSDALTIKCRIFKPIMNWYINRFAKWPQITEAFNTLHGVVYGVSLFKKHNLDEVQSKEIHTAGGRTLIGKVPTYCEYLHFTQKEVLTTPYPVLLLMIADKQRTLSDDDVVRVRMRAKDIMNVKS